MQHSGEMCSLRMLRVYLGMRIYRSRHPVPPEEKYRTIIQVAASDVSEVELAQWIRANLTKL